MTEKQKEQEPVYKQAWFWPVVIGGVVVVLVGLGAIAYAVQERQLRRRAATRKPHSIFAGVRKGLDEYDAAVAMEGKKIYKYDPRMEIQPLTAKQAKAQRKLEKIAASSPGESRFERLKTWARSRRS